MLLAGNNIKGINRRKNKNPFTFCTRRADWFVTATKNEKKKRRDMIQTRSLTGEKKKNTSPPSSSIGWGFSNITRLIVVCASLLLEKLLKKIAGTRNRLIRYARSVYLLLLHTRSVSMTSDAGHAHTHLCTWAHGSDSLLSKLYYAEASVWMTRDSCTFTLSGACLS